MPLLRLLVALSLLLLSAGTTLAQETVSPEEDEPEAEDEVFEPFAQSALHLGGGIEFSWSQTSVDRGGESNAVNFTLEADIGYFLIDGLKLSGVPFLTVTERNEALSFLVGAALGVGYYYDVGPVALFARGRGGMLFGQLINERTADTSGTGTDGTNRQLATALVFSDAVTTTEEGDVKGFVYGGGIGVALPIGNTILETAVEYVGSSVTVEGDFGSVDGTQNGILVRLSYFLGI